MSSLTTSFEEYGVELLNFSIEDISFDETDKGYQTVMEGIAESAKLRHLGVNYVQQKQMDIAQAAASNEGAGNFMGIGMGLAAGQHLGNVLNTAIKDCGITPPPPPPQNHTCSFFIAVNGQTTGPYTFEIIKDKILKTEISNNTYVYKVGSSEWTRARDCPELAQLLSILPPPPPINN